jgi:putative MATE family efflux protein
MAESPQFSQTTARLGSDPLGKLLLRLSLPSIVSMVAVSLYNLVDTFWVGKLGYQAVAAVTVTMPFFIMAFAVGAGTGVGINALTSRRFGERNSEAANQITGQIFFLAVALGLVFVLVTNLFPHQILKLCGATDDILDLGSQYLRVIGAGVPLLLLNLINRNVFQASGDAVRPMIMTITSQVVNAIFAPFLIFGWGPFPRLEMAGAGLAVVLANCVGVGMALWYLFRGRTAYRIKARHCKPNWADITAIYRVGLPSIVMQATEGVIFGLFNHVIAEFGSLALAGIGIAIRIADLAFMPIIGTSHGLLPIVGFSLGANLRERLWGAVRKTATWLAILMAVATLAVEIFTRPIISAFNNDPELLNLAVPGMRIFCSTFILIGPTIIFITTFQGLSKGKDAMLLSFARQLLFFLPGLYLLSYFFGLTGVWISMPVSDLLGFVTAAVWLAREYRLQNREFATLALNRAGANAKEREIFEDEPD